MFSNIIFSTLKPTQSFTIPYDEINKSSLTYEKYLNPLSNIYLKNLSRNTKRNTFTARSDSNQLLSISTNDLVNNLNSTIFSEAKYCLEKAHGTFYDTLNQICVTEMNFLPLTQGLKLEHIVYGKVSYFFLIFINI